MTSPLDPDQPLDPGVSSTARGFAAADAVTWARRELTVDGGRRALALLSRILGVVRTIGLLVVPVGILGAVLAVLATGGNPILRVVLVLACVPAIVAPFLARRSVGRVGAALAAPDQVVAQARDLAGNLKDSTELRKLVDRLRGREAAGLGRMRRAMGTARIASTVLDQAGPDPDRHPLLVPFLPERIGRLWQAVVWSWWGLLLASLVVVVSVAVQVAHAL